MFKLAILMTTFNRRETTLECLETVKTCLLPNSINLKVILVDDNSTDGTVESIKEKHPHVHIIQGSGKLFWNRGMRLAFLEAMKSKFDYYLWLNDDVLLKYDSINRIVIAAQKTNNNSIVVGSLQDPVTNVLTYGGVRRNSDWHPFKYELVIPSYESIEVDTMNGNLVLISSKIAEKVGNLDGKFTHSMGDFDYGYRAKMLGFSIIIAPNYFGTCPKNNIEKSWADTSLPRLIRWKLVNQPKGLPPNEWKVFARRYAGIFWPIYWMLPYLRIMLGR